MKLILLSYINRSGSTFLANLFSKSPDILVCPEGEVLMNELLVKPENPFILNDKNRKKFAFIFNEDPKLKWWGLTEDALDELPKDVSNLEIFISILGSYRDTVKPNAEIVMFKAERLIHLFEGLMHINSVHEICFLCIFRDCRGVYASQKTTKFPDSDKFMSLNPVQTAVAWNIHVKKALQLKKAGDIKLIKFEDLILNTSEVLPQLMKQLGIPKYDASKNQGDLFDRLPESHKSLHRNILEKAIPGKIEAWEQLLSKMEQGIIQNISKKSICLLGYKIEAVSSLWLYLTILYYISMYILYRMKNKFRILLRIR